MGRKQKKKNPMRVVPLDENPYETREFKPFDNPFTQQRGTEPKQEKKEEKDGLELLESPYKEEERPPAKKSKALPGMELHESPYKEEEGAKPDLDRPMDNPFGSPYTRIVPRKVKPARIALDMPKRKPKEEVEEKRGRTYPAKPRPRKKTA